MITTEEILKQLGDKSLVLIAKIVGSPTGTVVSGDFAMSGLSKTEAIGMIETIKATILNETLRDAGIAVSTGKKDDE